MAALDLVTRLRALVAEMADELDHNRRCLLDDSSLTDPLADLARAFLAQFPVNAWQPIDTALKDGTEILISDLDCIDIVHWANWSKTSFDRNYYREGWINREGEELYPCYWQPLPEQPEVEA